MMKVLLVEDLDIVRNDLKAMINWEEEGYQIVGEARDGQTGIRLFESTHPDIVISDIEMPVLNGLEMIREIQSRIKPGETGFILLTAYKEFEYARKAMEIGLDSYIVKYEITEELLKAELNRQKVHLQTIRSNQNQNGIAQARRWLERKSVNPLLLRQFLRDSEGFKMMLIGLVENSLDFDGKKLNDERIELKLNAMKFDELAEYKIHVIDIRQTEAVLFYQYERTPSTLMNLERKNKLYRVLSQLMETYGMQILIVDSNRVLDETNGPELYAEMKKALEKRYFCQNSGVFLLEHPPKKEAPAAPEEAERQFAGIRRLFMQDEPQKLPEAIRAFFTESIRETENLALFRRYMNELVYLFAEKANRLEDIKVIQQLDRLQPQLGQIGVYPAAEVFARLAESLGQSPQYSRKVKRIIQYINEHYAEDISLNMVAEEMNLSLIYVCQIFKKEVGMTFKTYLTKVRIREAERLLRTGEYKVYEVSRMVGYQTVQYFSKVFKQETGEYPKDV